MKQPKPANIHWKNGENQTIKWAVDQRTSDISWETSEKQNSEGGKWLFKEININIQRNIRGKEEQKHLIASKLKN